MADQQSSTRLAFVLLLGGSILAALISTCAVHGSNLGPLEAYLRYPPRPMPSKACACRVDMQKRAVAATCPSPWESIAGTTKVPPALKLSPRGDLVEADSGSVARLHGINWFGWETDSPSVDGLWAYDDSELPPTSAVSNASIEQLGVNFWGKRTMTNDFAHVVHRIKALGFNAVRLPFNFTNLQKDLPQPKWDATEFYACVRDPINFINLKKTLDPNLAHLPADQLAAAAPAYSGMPHPPPFKAGDDAACAAVWEVPFDSSYKAPEQYGDKLQLTMCNWYLPQGVGVQAIHRFLWQLQYLIAQGFYVVIDHHSYQETDPNMLNPALFAANWGNLWRTIAELPGYTENIKGRVFPDLVNEPSRWGCQWERECYNAQGHKACAAGAWLYHEAMRAIHSSDPDVPVLANAMGQSYVDPVKFPTCTKFFKGMNYGEGTITRKEVIAATGISDPLSFFKEMPAISSGKLVLAPHVYPGTLTGLGVETQSKASLFARLDLSFGLKALGRDLTSDMQPLDRMAVILGEFGVPDHGKPTPPQSPAATAAAEGRHLEANNSFPANGDFSSIADVDVTFLQDLAEYLRGLEVQGATVSWFWWAWNANSGDTKGIVGPSDTWRDVQFTKVRLLSELYGLRPWYCNAAANACPCKGAGCINKSVSNSNDGSSSSSSSSDGMQILTMPHAGAAVDFSNLFSLSLSIGRRLKAFKP